MSISELAMLVNDNFDKPLNRQIEDMVRLIPSDTQLYDIKTLTINDSLEISVSDNAQSTQGIVLKSSGLANLKVDLKFSKRFVNFGSTTVLTQILKNNSIIGSNSTYIEVRQSEDVLWEDLIVLPNMTFNSGDSIKVNVSTTGSSNGAYSTIYNIRADFKFYATTTFSPEIISVE